MKQEQYKSLCVVVVVAAVTALAAMAPLAPAAAAILPKDSALFTKKFEMNTPTNEVDPTGNTGEWTLHTGGTSSASLSGGALNVDTSGDIANGRYWDSNTWVAASSAATGWTLEVSVRVDSFIDDGAGGAEHRTFQIWAGDGAQTLLVSVGPDRTYSGFPSSPTLIDSNNNADTFHVFRIAKDAGASVFQVWRDGVQIGTNLPQSFVDHDLYFGDGGGDYSGSGAFDYVRWDATGAFSPPVPEPSSAAFLGAFGLLMLKRRKH